ncbi:hypothetical protein [Subtercola boreus]|uniref:Uncharacterized protein n=1 Tax=Subtercola boreus TaxID=120213 RepID=A0A3E0W9V0_9MICO|nr:hypothetical protein [Subtercola boreus]RFA18690.1 hypothetical protein B7R24_14105 [Subtercola boreus]RFA18712.1 hypothetical protein B7R23_14145 [Subtercola boreus]RFA25323.1 hypothetical protein B7R25_14210 [Subtercola boreus]
MSTAENTPDDRRDLPADTRRDDHIDDRREYPVETRRDDETAAVVADSQLSHRQEVLEREKEKYGGVKVGSAFFGWLTATGTAVILTALVAATGAAVGLGNANGDANQAAQAATENVNTVGVVGAIALLVVLFVAYLAGGYVAGRMARFNGAKQGLAVWLWAVVIAIVVAIVAAVAGSQYNILGNLNSFPRIPVDEGALTITSIVTLLVVAVASLAGAVLGGLAGMRFHRRVDRAGLGR